VRKPQAVERSADASAASCARGVPEPGGGRRVAAGALARRRSRVRVRSRVAVRRRSVAQPPSAVFPRCQGRFLAPELLSRRTGRAGSEKEEPRTSVRAAARTRNVPAPRKTAQAEARHRSRRRLRLSRFKKNMAAVQPAGCDTTNARGFCRECVRCSSRSSPARTTRSSWGEGLRERGTQRVGHAPIAKSPDREITKDTGSGAVRPPRAALRDAAPCARQSIIAAAWLGGSLALPVRARPPGARSPSRCALVLPVRARPPGAR